MVTMLFLLHLELLSKFLSTQIRKCLLLYYFLSNRAGKTYSIFGSNHGSSTSPGLVSIAVRNLFSSLQKRHESIDPTFDIQRDVSVRVSFVELYNNAFRNLLPLENNSAAAHNTVSNMSNNVRKRLSLI